MIGNLFVGSQLQTLHQQVRQSRAAALAQGTKNNLWTQIRAFISFCIYFHLQPIPVSYVNLSLYIACLSNSFKSPSTVMNYVCGVKTAHDMLDAQFPSLKCYLFRMQMKGLTKQMAHAPKRAGILTPDVLIKIRSKLRMHMSFHACIWSLFCIAFFSFARLSNLISRTTRLFDVTKHLTRSDIILTQDSLLLNFKWSKTLQDHSRLISIPLVRMPDSPLCPVAAYSTLLSLVDIPLNKSAFSYLQKSKLTMLTAPRLVSTFRILLQAVGLQSSNYSGHSFRRSGATWAFRAGVRSESIKNQGDWRSFAYLNYIQITDDQKQLVSRQMAAAI
jgi:hypothetical protein